MLLEGSMRMPHALARREASNNIAITTLDLEEGARNETSALLHLVEHALHSGA